MLAAKMDALSGRPKLEPNRSRRVKNERRKKAMGAISKKRAKKIIA
jgi:hypothetical protein